MSIVLENILRFVSKGYFQFPRLGGTNPSSGTLGVLNAKACCSGCVVPPFIRVPVTSMCGVVVVGVCVYTYTYAYRSCIDIYTYRILPIDLSPTTQSVGRWLCVNGSVKVTARANPEARRTCSPSDRFLSIFCFCLKPSYCSFKYFCIT